MPTRIFAKPFDVDNRLELMGLTRELLLDGVAAMVAAKADVTLNDPAGAGGWSAWRMGTRRLREVLLPLGEYEREEVDQIPAVVCRSRGVRIVVANTDDATGVIDPDGRIPQNRSKKGAATDRVVNANQGSFIDVLTENLNVVRLLRPGEIHAPVVTTHYLCVYSDGDTIRAELSVPTSIENGFFTDFDQRVFLTASESDGGTFARRLPGPDGGNEFDVPVSRKK